MKELRNSVCIVGVDESDELGTLPHKSQLTLHVEAVRNAVRDAGLKISDVDGIFTAGQHSPATIGEALGIVPRYVDGTTVGGCSFIIMVGHALVALHHGLCDVAVVCHGESGRSGVGVTPRRDTALPGQYEAPFGFGGASTHVRHDHDAPHARARDHARAVGAGGRLHAPVGGAQPQGEEPRAHHHRRCAQLAPRLLPVQPPEHLPRDRRGRRRRADARRPREGLRQEARLRARRGRGDRAREPDADEEPDLQRGHEASPAPRPSRWPASTHKDFNHLMFYDAFTSGPPIMLESLGFCKPGEGVRYFENGKSTPGGSLPINTNGGGLSYTHSGMYGIFPIIEAARQLRGECGPRQVPNCKVSLVNGMGGMLSAAGTLVLSNEK